MTVNPPSDHLADPDDEQEASHRFALTLAPRIGALIERQESSERTPDDRSSLAADDRYTKPFQSSHAVWLALTHAVDNLHALRTLTVRGDLPNLVVHTHPYAAYPLIRAAYENASQAMWLLTPANRNDRLTRRFRLLLTDGKHRDQMGGLTGLSTTAHAERLARIDPVIVARKLDRVECLRTVGNRAFVRGAATATGGDPDYAEAVWSALSGLSHGDMWASMSSTDREVVAVSDDGTATARITSSIRNVERLTSVALNGTEAALRVYDKRSNQLAVDR